MISLRPPAAENAMKIAYIVRRRRRWHSQFTRMSHLHFNSILYCVAGEGGHGNERIVNDMIVWVGLFFRTPSAGTIYGK